MIFPLGQLGRVLAVCVIGATVAGARAQEPMDFAGRLRTELAARAAWPSSPPPLRTPQVTPVPELSHWLERLGKSRRPARSDAHLPVIRAAFAAQGLPEALVWLAETESSFDPAARSPVGALGLFQLMPATATSLGLFLYPLDQRTHPQASATAAAIYLRRLHARFGDWPLALAAYNAGEGLVGRTLKARGATDFAGIAEHLPAETRHYVPRVLATVQLRAGVRLSELGGPSPRS